MSNSTISTTDKKAKGSAGRHRRQSSVPTDGSPEKRKLLREIERGDRADARAMREMHAPADAAVEETDTSPPAGATSPPPGDDVGAGAVDETLGARGTPRISPMSEENIFSALRAERAEREAALATINSGLADLTLLVRGLATQLPRSPPAPPTSRQSDTDPEVNDVHPRSAMGSATTTNTIGAAAAAAAAAAAVTTDDDDDDDDDDDEDDADDADDGDGDADTARATTVAGRHAATPRAQSHARAAYETAARTVRPRLPFPDRLEPVDEEVALLQPLRDHTERLRRDTANIAACAQEWARAFPENFSESEPHGAEVRAIHTRLARKEGGQVVVAKGDGAELDSSLSPLATLLRYLGVVAAALAVDATFAGPAGVDGETHAVMWSALLNAIRRAQLVVECRYTRLRVAHSGSTAEARLLEQTLDSASAPVQRRRQYERLQRLQIEAEEDAAGGAATAKRIDALTKAIKDLESKVATTNNKPKGAPRGGGGGGGASGGASAHPSGAVNASAPPSTETAQAAAQPAAQPSNNNHTDKADKQDKKAGAKAGAKAK